MGGAKKYKEVQGIPWRVLVDDIEGKVHQVYGGLADPTYIIDTEGRIAFYNMWTHVPTLHKATETLFKQDGYGVVGGGIDKIPHLLPSMVNGWPAIARGLPQSFSDLEKAVPGSAQSLRMGYQMKSILAPLALRSTPLPQSARFIMKAIGVLVVLRILKSYWYKETVIGVPTQKIKTHERC